MAAFLYYEEYFGEWPEYSGGHISGVLVRGSSLHTSPSRYGAGLQNPERPTSATGKALSALTEQMEKMNVVQVELQTEVAERRIQLEKDREAHREEIKKVGGVGRRGSAGERGDRGAEVWW